MRIYELLIQKLIGAILVLLGTIIIVILPEDNTVSMVLFSIGIYFIIKKDVIPELFENFE